MSLRHIRKLHCINPSTLARRNIRRYTKSTVVIKFRPSSRFRPVSLISGFSFRSLNNTRLYHDLKAEMPEAKPFERLPKTITPVNYNIRLKPNLKAFTFEGSEDIDIEVQ